MFLAASLKAQQYDFILAGQTANVIYTNLIPDFDTVGELYQPHWTGECGYDLNLNNDSIPDYNIHLQIQGSNSGGQTTVVISAIDTANRIAAEYDSLYCFPWDTLPVLNLCRSLVEGDTIDEFHQEWIPTAIMLWSSSFQLYGQCKNGDWLDLQPHIAGLMMPNQGDLIFGWVRIQTARNWMNKIDSLVVFDYAATKGFEIEPPIINADTVLRVYPNPSFGDIQIHSNEVSKYELLNCAGAIVKSGWLQIGVTSISTEHLASNYYFIAIYQSDRRKVMKVSVIRN